MICSPVCCAARAIAPASAVKKRAFRCTDCAGPSVISGMTAVPSWAACWLPICSRCKRLPLFHARKVPLKLGMTHSEEKTQRLSKRCYAVAKPSEAAKRSGMPNSFIVTWPAVEGRALRANRSAHERRAWARWARERITSAVRGEAAAAGGRLTSMRWCRTSCIQARRCSLRLQSRQSSGAGPTRSGWSRTLMRRGFVVACPCH